MAPLHLESALLLQPPKLRKQILSAAMVHTKSVEQIAHSCIIIIIIENCKKQANKRITPMQF
jgi:hypothetical protein